MFFYSKTTFIFFLFFEFSLAYIYLHNPRGSNNRLDEKTQPRSNNFRLFDSENNERGGYNVGGLFYYSGSLLHLEWTNKHNCENFINNCVIILQYMCSPNLRDGTSTETIPLDNENCDGNNCNEDWTYGMHEDYFYYQNCQSQRRNFGLFTANQKLTGDSALHTRQNTKGARYGYECPEERDYYPYWRSSPWKDIAVLTNNVSRCEYYQQESENVKSRWSCELPSEVLHDLINRRLAIPIDKEACEAFSYPPNVPNGKKGVWKESPSHQLPPPECREPEYTRDNHLGNGLGKFPVSYQWTLPNLDNQRCILRIRHNISTLDFDGWSSDLNSTLNEEKIPLKVLDSFWSDEDDSNATDRGFNLETNPQVEIFKGLDLKLQLAVDMAHFGRVFEDRSHMFGIKRKPDYISSDTIIHNLNVRGKRGNIVQVYPAVEYDFVPQILEMTKGDYVHIQWTGSNSNPKENDGQGLDGTDRSNLVPLMDLLENQPEHTYGHLGRSYPNNISQVANKFLGLNFSDLNALAFLQPALTSGSLSTLDDAGTYFNLGLREMKQLGVFNFMCTRNNNFSNRDQKGKIVVTKAALKTFTVGWNGGNFSIGSSFISAERGVFTKLTRLRVEEWSKEDVAKSPKLKPLRPRIEQNLASNVLLIESDDRIPIDGKAIQVRLTIYGNSKDSAHVYRTSVSDSSIWQRLDARTQNGMATFYTDKGGVFFLKTHHSSNTVLIAVVVTIVISFLLVGLSVYFLKNKNGWKTLRSIGQRTKRSFQSQL